MVGRVQSVALKLISDRDAEIEAFEPEEYWSVETIVETPGGNMLNASVIEVILFALNMSATNLAC